MNSYSLALTFAFLSILGLALPGCEGDTETKNGLPSGEAFLAMQSASTALVEAGSASKDDQAGSVKPSAARETYSVDNLSVSSSNGGNAVFSGSIVTSTDTYSIQSDTTFNQWVTAGGATVDGSGASDYTFDLSSFSYDGTFSGDYTITYNGTEYSIEMDYTLKFSLQGDLEFKGYAVIDGTRYEFDESY